jgi:acyl-coenzyme A synthetase/AMP-(fatty) acid ligase
LVGCAGALIDDELYVFGRWDDTLTVNGQQFTAGVLESAVRGVAGANDAAVVRINGPDGAICAVVEVGPQAQLEAAAVQEAIARARAAAIRAG